MCSLWFPGIKSTEVWRRSWAELEVDQDHAHLFLSIPPKYSIGQVVELFKAVSVREIRAGFPEVRKQLWVESFRKIDILCGPWGIR